MQLIRHNVVMYKVILLEYCWLLLLNSINKANIPILLYWLLWYKLNWRVVIIRAIIKITVWCVMIGVTIYLTRVRKHKPQDDYINGVRFGKLVINPFKIRELKQQAKKFCDRVNC